MKELPKFKYHSDPLSTGSIVKRPVKCPVCEQDQEYAYEGPFYSTDEVEDICPWCIENGKAAEKFNGEFQDYCGIEGISPDPSNPDKHPYNEDHIDELITRTPGYYGIQQEQWLCHCNEPCNYIGQVGWKEIEELEIDVNEDIKIEAQKYRMTVDEFKQGLINKGFMQGYLFQCLHCGKYRLYTDID